MGSYAWFAPRRAPALDRDLREVPQLAQNPRVTGADERYSARAPRVRRKLARAKVPQGTMGAPAALRQLAQWQKHRLLTAPDTW